MNIETHKPDFDKAIERLKTEIGALRTNRATPALVENIQVAVYGSKQLLKALAALSVSDPKTLYVEPWDKTTIKEIEKAIVDAGSGLNPVNEGSRLRITLPAMTEESRKELSKLLSVKIEESRIAVRNVREKIRTAIIAGEKDKTVTEDEKYKLQEKLDKMIADYNEQIHKIGEAKDKEIMTV